MSKVFMLTFDNAVVPRDVLLRFLDSRPEVSNWHASTPQNLVFIVSDRSIEELTSLLKKQGDVDTFLLVEVSSEMVGQQVKGWLPQSTWDFISKGPAHPQLELPTKA
jgi:hypothetical protein